MMNIMACRATRKHLLKGSQYSWPPCCD